MAREVAIQAQSLYREYISEYGTIRRERKTTVALDHIDLTVNAGELFGVVGPNGAGKTTLTKILSTVLLPTSGQISVLGFDVVKRASDVRQRIGLVLGGERGLYLRLSGLDNLRYFATLYNVPRFETDTRIATLLDLVGLSDRADERVENYSRGMKQRLHLARGLINQPALILLDEPTIGLDPGAARSIRQTVRSLADGGATILMTSHYLFEVDELCDRIAVLHHGQVHFVGRPDQFKERLANRRVVQLDLDPVVQVDSDLIRRMEFVSSVQIVPKDAAITVLVQTVNPVVLLPALLQLFPSSRVQNVTLHQPTLEDTYLDLLGQDAIG